MVTTSLMAALEFHNGKVTGKCEQRHTHKEFLEFLKKLVRIYRKKGREIHIICDNYSTHIHKKVKEWLVTQKNVHMHFTPTQVSWLNQIEIWFSIMRRRVLKQGIFTSVPDLVQKTKWFIPEYNPSAKPFA